MNVLIIVSGDLSRFRLFFFLAETILSTDDDAVGTGQIGIDDLQ